MSDDLRQTLTALYRDLGKLTPRLLLDTAADPDHPLHDRFDWDNDTAGDKYRLLQASALIRSVRIRYVDLPEPKETRAFHPIPRPEGGRSYVPAEDVAADEFSRELVLRTMRREWQEYKRRYQHFAEFAELVAPQRNSA